MSLHPNQIPPSHINALDDTFLSRKHTKMKHALKQNTRYLDFKGQVTAEQSLNINYQVGNIPAPNLTSEELIRRNQTHTFLGRGSLTTVSMLSASVLLRN